MTQQTQTGSSPSTTQAKAIWFERRELDQILWTYGKLVSEGECRDYAIGAFRDHAAFCMFKRAAEAPTWTVEKWPELARKQGAYVLTNATGQVLKRGHELGPVLAFFDKKRFQVVD
jgi:Protein of unknown function (DUF2794)